MAEATLRPLLSSIGPWARFWRLPCSLFCWEGPAAVALTPVALAELLFMLLDFKVAYYFIFKFK